MTRGRRGMRRRRRPPRSEILPVRDVHVVPIDRKGNGVVARRDLQPNSRLVYVGRTLDQAAFQRLTERAKREPARGLTAYLMAEGRAGFYLDAHPRRPEHSTSWIAGSVNEPRRGETANMIIGQQLFPGVRRRLAPVLIAVRRIVVGEELTVKYGGSFTRTYHVGRAPRKPSWL
jgi:hypothetical protein